MNDVDIAEGHELCGSCRRPLEFGECYTAVTVGAVQWAPHVTPQPVTEPWCRACTREEAA